ncbi:MAG TPA: glycosyltransferase [Candidatus Binataceae bacterium]|nr:glycosyltransferase [Candidatus Binataceae bacterium]
MKASIIIPSAGNAARLGPCLESLARQTVRNGVEVLVVLDGEVGCHSQAVQLLRARRDWPWPIHWFMLGAQRGTYAACNRGAAEAHGRNLIFLDDDMIAAPDLIATHLELLGQNPDTVIEGAIKTRCVGYSGVYRFSIENFWNRRHQRLTREPVVNFEDCYSGNLAMANEIFRGVSGFDESFPRGGDLELGLRLERAHVPMLLRSRRAGGSAIRQEPTPEDARPRDGGREQGHNMAEV